MLQGRAPGCGSISYWPCDLEDVATPTELQLPPLRNRENHPAFRRKCPGLVNTYCLCFPFPGRDTGSPRWLTERPRVAERGPGDRCHCGEGRRAAVARAVGRERVSVYLERPSKEQRLSMDNREIKSESNGHL